MLIVKNFYLIFPARYQDTSRGARRECFLWKKKKCRREFPIVERHEL